MTFLLFSRMLNLFQFLITYIHWWNLHQKWNYNHQSYHLTKIETFVLRFYAASHQWYPTWPEYQESTNNVADKVLFIPLSEEIGSHPEHWQPQYWHFAELSTTCHILLCVESVPVMLPPVTRRHGHRLPLRSDVCRPVVVPRLTVGSGTPVENQTVIGLVGR